MQCYRVFRDCTFCDTKAFPNFLIYDLIVALLSTCVSYKLNNKICHGRKIFKPNETLKSYNFDKFWYLIHKH